MGGFVLLSWQGFLPWFVTILIAVRELGITAMRAFFLRRGVVVSANWMGKLKTFFQIIALGTLLIPWEHFYAIDRANQWWVILVIRLGLALSGIALALTLISGVAYVVEGVTLMRTPAIVDSHKADGGHAVSADSSPAGQPIQS